MVGIIYENMVIWSAIHNLTTTTSEGTFVSKNNSIKVVYINMLPCIILQEEIQIKVEKVWLNVNICYDELIIENCIKYNKKDLGHSLINIIPIWFVDNHTRPKVVFVRCNIIIHESNDVLIF